MSAWYQTKSDFDSFLQQFRLVLSRSTVQPGSTQPWYALNQNNTSQKIVDVEELGARLVDFLNNFSEGDSLDMLRVGLTYGAVEDYLTSTVNP